MTNILPMKDCELTQDYGQKNQAYKKGYHTGADYAARGADKSVYAVAAGVVIRARFTAGARGADPKGWGNYVIVRTADGYDLIHAHLALSAVTQGMVVAPGERLGIQGSTGNSSGPHLHFEVRKEPWTNCNDVNPVAWLRKLEQKPAVTIRLLDASGNVKKTHDGVKISGITYGPARALMETYGHVVKWDGYKVDIIE